MVKILANGDIVPDDDPRVNAEKRRTRAAEVHQIRHEEHDDDNGQGDGQQGQSVSVFHMLNEKLLNMGVPRWNLGDTVVEPIASVGLLVLLIMFGIRGVLLFAFIFIVIKFSQGYSLRSLYQNIMGTGQGRHRGHDSTRRNTGRPGARLGGRSTTGNRLGYS